MQEVARRFTGVPGVVLHMGDSNTFDPAYSAWALGVEDKTAGEKALFKWMHTGVGGKVDGWTLCSRPTRPGASATASNGIQLGQFLKGTGHDHSFLRVVKSYNPQAVVVMLGTNDASFGRSTKEFSKALRKAVEILLQNGTVPLMVTLPPHGRLPGEIVDYNFAIQALSREKKLPLVDLYGEMLRRRPSDWQDYLMKKDGLHLSAGNAAGPITEGNLNHSGQLLRSWLTVSKVGEIKSLVFDKLAENQHGKK